MAVAQFTKTLLVAVNSTINNETVEDKFIFLKNKYANLSPIIIKSKLTNLTIAYPITGKDLE